MNHRTLKTFLSTVVLVMAVLQKPYIYYYTDGLFSFFDVALYALTGLILTIVLYCLYRQNKSTNTTYHLIGLIASVTLGTFALLSEDTMIENIDWHLRLTERNRIVEKVKQGEFVPNNALHNGMYELPIDNLPPISNGGNEINIIENYKGVTSVEFFIDRGFLDHYSAFLYTNDKTKMAEMDSTVKARQIPNFRKLNKNWYRIAY